VKKERRKEKEQSMRKKGSGGGKMIMWKREEYREKGRSLGKTRKCGKKTVVRKKIWCKGKRIYVTDGKQLHMHYKKE
jgi:hypothetical protein